MEEHKYSITELDRMRKAVEYLLKPRPFSDPVISDVEERLRTYMLNGTSVEELEDWVAKIREKRKALKLVNLRREYA